MPHVQYQTCLIMHSYTLLTQGDLYCTKWSLLYRLPQKKICFQRLWYLKIYRNTFSISLSNYLRETFYLLILMFISGLETYRSERVGKVSCSVPCIFPNGAFSATLFSVRIPMGKNYWTKLFFDFRKWSVSRPLDHLWKNKFYLEV